MKTEKKLNVAIFSLLGLSITSCILGGIIRFVFPYGSGSNYTEGVIGLTMGATLLFFSMVLATALALRKAEWWRKVLAFLFTVLFLALSILVFYSAAITFSGQKIIIR